MQHTMLAHALLVLALTCTARGEQAKDKDPFAVLDQHLSQPRDSQHPWSPLLQAAAALDSLENPKISSDAHKLQITMTVRRFKPDELNIRVEDNYIVVEGDHKESNADKNVFSNRFVQRFVMPAGSRPEQVAAVLREDGVLSITVPKRAPPPFSLDLTISESDTTGKTLKPSPTMIME